MRMSTMLVLVLMSSLSACVPDPAVEAQSSSVAPEAVPASGRHWSRVSEPLPVPVVDEPPAVKIEWFKGVSELPAGHPCRDDANVVYLSDDLECEPARFRLTSASLGVLRKKNGHPLSSWTPQESGSTHRHKCKDRSTS